ncbi:MAG: ferredoxin [Cyanobacteriota bacterium]|nr:ferredoxin [Cyanobacteriota bacterium]
MNSDFSPSPPTEADERSGFEPELGGMLREADERSGFEPELGGALRQKGVYVDELTCIGCKHCAHVARNTFYIEAEYGRARVFDQDGDSEDAIQEAIDTCPVNCIHSIDYTELKDLEDKRKHQVIPRAGFPVSKGKMMSAQRSRQKKKTAKKRPRA